MYGVTLASIARASICASPKVFWHVEAAVDHSAATVVGILVRQGTGNRHKTREREMLENKLKVKKPAVNMLRYFERGPECNS